MDVAKSKHPTLPLAAAALAALASCASPPPLVEGTAPPVGFTTTPSIAPYTLGPGDLVRVTVYGHPELAPPEFPLRIDPEGLLSLPYTGSIPLDGKTVREARGVIEAALRGFMNDPAVGLTVDEYAARRAFVLGHVRAPGAYVLDRPMTALQALTLAGGVGEGGDREQVAILRERDGELQVHFFNAATPAADGLVIVEPDDLVFVRQSRSGAFKEQIVPVLNAAAPIFGAFTNLIVVSDALND